MDKLNKSEEVLDERALGYEFDGLARASLQRIMQLEETDWNEAAIKVKGTIDHLATYVAKRFIALGGNDSVLYLFHRSLEFVKREMWETGAQETLGQMVYASSGNLRDLIPLKIYEHFTSQSDSDADPKTSGDSSVSDGVADVLGT